MYEIKISRLLPPDEKRDYERTAEVYTQRIENIDLTKIIAAVNAKYEQSGDSSS